MPTEKIDVLEAYLAYKSVTDRNSDREVPTGPLSLLLEKSLFSVEKQGVEYYSKLLALENQSK